MRLASQAVSVTPPQLFQRNFSHNSGKGTLFPSSRRPTEPHDNSWQLCFLKINRSVPFISRSSHVALDCCRTDNDPESIRVDQSRRAFRKSQRNAPLILVLFQQSCSSPAFLTAEDSTLPRRLEVLWSVFRSCAAIFDPDMSPSPNISENFVVAIAGGSQVGIFIFLFTISTIPTLYIIATEDIGDLHNREKRTDATTKDPPSDGTARRSAQSLDHTLSYPGTTVACDVQLRNASVRMGRKQKQRHLANHAMEHAMEDRLGRYFEVGKAEGRRGTLGNYANVIPGQTCPSHKGKKIRMEGCVTGLCHRRHEDANGNDGNVYCR